MYNSRKEFMTSYHLESACCGTTFEDKEWELECPHKDGAALIYANYAKRQFEVRNDLPGIYRYANWMPICGRWKVPGCSQVLIKERGAV